MLVFFIHGVNTQDASYAKYLIKNINKEFSERGVRENPSFYSSFWGNCFNNKKQKITGHIDRDFSRACKSADLGLFPKNDVYRYQKQRNSFINNFLGDFLIYQNHERGAEIRKTITLQLRQFLKDNPRKKEIHFVSHSLGSIILWDLIFSNNIEANITSDFQQVLTELDLVSITTMGSPLLFFKEFLDLNFEILDSLVNYKPSSSSNNIDFCRLRWMNLIHSSDLVAYPLKSVIEEEISSKILIADHYIWRDANSAETLLHMTKGQNEAAILVGAKDAHNSYLNKYTSGLISGRIITQNILGKTQELSKKLIHSK